MREQLITRKDDNVGEGTFDSIAWAFEQHVKTADTGIYNAAILYGNEDSPEWIDFYTQAEPKVTDSVAYHWERSPFRPFVDINELTDWLKRNEYVYYHAPMDIKPVRVRVKSYTVSNENSARNRATLWTPATKSFVVNLTAHFDRFRILTDQE